MDFVIKDVVVHRRLQNSRYDCFAVYVHRGWIVSFVFIVVTQYCHFDVNRDVAGLHQAIIMYNQPYREANDKNKSFRFIQY